MAQQTRSEWWFLMSYATLGELQQLFENCHHYAFCVHDKDTNEDGTTKEKHTHILVKFETKKSLDQIRTLINSSQNTFGECQRKVGKNWVSLNKTACYRYLLHLDDISKHQYEKQERVSDDDDWWTTYEEYKGQTTTTDDTLYQDLVQPYTSRYEFLDSMATKYGRDFIKNLNSYDNFRALINIAEIEHDSIADIEADPDREQFLKLMAEYNYTYKDLIRLMEHEYYVQKRYEYLYKSEQSKKIILK